MTIFELSAEGDATRRRFLIALAVAIAAFLGGFVGGRFSAPLKVETRDVVKMVTDTSKVTALEQKLASQQQELEQWKSSSHTVVVKEPVLLKCAPGAAPVVATRETITTDKDREASKTASASATAETHATETDHVTAASEQTHTQTVTLRPQWRVSLLAGASLPKPALQLYGPLVLGAEVDYRIVGGLSAGVWLNTVGAAGLALTLEF